MQYKRFGSIVAVAVASAVGWTLNVNFNFRPVQAETPGGKEIAADSTEQSTVSDTSASPTTVAKVGEPATAQSSEGAGLAVATVFPHELETRSAATVYVRDIPVLTFIDSTASGSASDTDDVSAEISQAEGDVPEGRKLATKAEDDSSAVLRANQLAAKLNSLSIAGDVDADEIAVKWQEDQYLVHVGGDALVTMTEDVILPDTTGARAEDALQATNRLRRLLGDEAAEPLNEVADLPAPPEPEPEPVVAAAPASEYYQEGMASWYGPGFHGNLTANGEIFNQNALTAAHRYLAFGTWVRVTNLHNGYSVNVRINDRGPYSGGRVIDLSAAAADYIGLTSAGVAPVQVDILY